MAQLITEGEGPNTLTLAFPDAWVVVKYDQPGAHFYQQCIKPLGADLTAVDVVAATADGRRLWLIEVKDFRGHEVKNRKRLTSGSLGAEDYSTSCTRLRGCLRASTAGSPSCESWKRLFATPM